MPYLEGDEGDAGLAAALQSAMPQLLDEAINSLGRYLQDTSHLDEARRLYEVSLAAGRDVRLNLANLLSDDPGQQARAQHLYEDLLAAGDVDALNNLAQLLTNRGETRRAEDLYKEAIGRDDTLAWENYALFLLEEDRLAEAEATLSALAESHPDVGERPLADLYALTGRWREAVPLYSREHSRGARLPAAISRAVRSEGDLSSERIEQSLQRSRGSRVCEALTFRRSRSS